MRDEVTSFAVKRGDLVLDMGSGPGTLSRVVAGAGGRPVLLDVSRSMLKSAPFPDRVLGSFEHLPFRDGCFDGVVSGFAVRDSFDLGSALTQVKRVLRKDGRFAFCDLGKPHSALKSTALAYYLRTIPNLIGLATAGRNGLRYGSLFVTYMLVLDNAELLRVLSSLFEGASLHEMQLGGAIVAKCIR